jgi:hypothetical protein
MQKPPDDTLCKVLSDLSELKERLENELIANRLPLDTLSIDTVLRVHRRVGDELYRALRFVQDVACGHAHRPGAKSRRGAN